MNFSATDKKDLIWAMRSALLEATSEKVSVMESSVIDETVDFIKKEATYEQLLNLVYNPNRKQNYLESDILEFVASKAILDIANFYPSSGLNTVQEKFNILESVLNEGSTTDSTGFRITKDNPGNKQTDKLYQSSNTAWNKTKLWAERQVDSVNKYFKNMSMADKAKYKKIAIWATGGVALAAASMFIYKKYFSAKAKACKNASDPKACIAKIKKEGAKAAISALNTAKGSCGKSKNPDKCKAKMDKQISRWKAKAA